jgi:hypothetical protein
MIPLSDTGHPRGSIRINHLRRDGESKITAHGLKVASSD